MFIEYTKLCFMINAILGALFWTLQSSESWFAVVLVMSNLWITLNYFASSFGRTLNLVVHLLSLTTIGLLLFREENSSHTGFLFHGPFSAPVIAVMVLTLLTLDLFNFKPEI